MSTVVPAEASSVDSLHMSWQTTTTPLEAIERALYKLAAQLSGSVDEINGRWAVEIHPRSRDANVDGLTHQMRQEVTDQTLRLRIAERTDPIRNLIFAMAFSRSGLSSGGSERIDAS